MQSGLSFLPWAYSKQLVEGITPVYLNIVGLKPNMLFVPPIIKLNAYLSQVVFVLQEGGRPFLFF